MSHCYECAMLIREGCDPVSQCLNCDDDNTVEADGNLMLREIQEAS